MNVVQRQELHRKTTEQLQQDLAEAERTLLTLQFDAGMKRLTNPSAIHSTRKQIARLKTLLRQRELLAENDFASMDEYKAYKVAERRSFQERRKY